MTETPNDTPRLELQELDSLLSTSHDKRVFDVLQSFAARLKKRRQAVFNAPGALLLLPIDCARAREQGIWPEEEDNFQLLQGDLIYISAAYFMGERLENGCFAVANATCDLVPDRRDYVALLPVRAIYAPASPEEEFRLRSLLGELLSFKSPQRMYLPPLPNDAPEVLARFIDFNGIAQAASVDVRVATRTASLSLIGWRIFGVHLRRLLTRAGENEVSLRRNST